MKTNGIQSAELRTVLSLDPAGILGAIRDGAADVVESFEAGGDDDAAQAWREFCLTIETLEPMARSLPPLMMPVGEPMKLPVDSPDG